MKRILYVDMDGVLVNFESAFPHFSADMIKLHEGRLDEIPGIFGFMEPMMGALEAYHELALIFDTYILSTSPWDNPSAWSDKLLWVKRYLGSVAYKRLIISHHKNLNRGDFLIDDRRKNGADNFQGELILYGSAAFPNWEKICQYLRQKAG